MSRVFIPAARYDEFIAAAVRRAGARRVRGQFDAECDMGPLVDSRQMERVLGLIGEGVAGGARVACGGVRVGEVGCFVAPTVLADVEDGNAVARTEIFGPVMCCLRYAGGLEEAIARANAVPFGLAATLLTTSHATALRGARELVAGTVWINTHGVFDPAIPYGGLKESGWGKEYGDEGLEGYLGTKTVVLA
jgi:acyl-CoA reductase-like NAD-dependent aldehyde dehydrogenase